MSVRTGQARLQRLAAQINCGALLTEEDREFLTGALQKIASGADAEAALGVKAQKGERKGLYAQFSKVRKDFLNGWLAMAIAHEKEGGLGMTLKDAVSTIKAKMSDLPSEDSLRRQWNNVRLTQGKVFKIKAD